MSEEGSKTKAKPWPGSLCLKGAMEKMNDVAKGRGEEEEEEAGILEG